MPNARPLTPASPRFESRQRLMLSALWLLALLMLTGCAGEHVRGELRYHIDPNLDQRRLVWPEPPEVPRYLYAGELIGEANFRPSGEELRKGARGFFNWVVGLFEETREEVITLQRPQSGVVDEQGRIYVTDVSRKAVFVFDEKEGQLLIWERAMGLSRFAAPTGIALGANGEVLVADADLGMVVRLDRNGVAKGTIGKGMLRRPTGLARDSRQRLIYVSDTHAHDVKVFDDEGRLIRVIGRRGDGDGEFNFPTYLTFAHDRLYVTDTMNNRVQVFSGEGEFIEMRFGQRGLFVGNLVRPKGIAVDDEGNTYVVESYYDHLLVYNGGGQFLMAIGGSGTQAGKFFLPAGVWVDSRNRVFVADQFNGRVAIFQFLGARDG